jgi:hypothetical protein
MMEDAKDEQQKTLGRDETDVIPPCRREPVKFPPS